MPIFVRSGSVKVINRWERSRAGTKARIIGGDLPGVLINFRAAARILEISVLKALEERTSAEE